MPQPSVYLRFLSWRRGELLEKNLFAVFKKSSNSFRPITDKLDDEGVMPTPLRCPIGYYPLSPPHPLCAPPTHNKGISVITCSLLYKLHILLYLSILLARLKLRGFCGWRLDWFYMPHALYTMCSVFQLGVRIREKKIQIRIRFSKESDTFQTFFTFLSTKGVIE